MLHAQAHIRGALNYTASQTTRYWHIGCTATALEHFFLGENYNDTLPLQFKDSVKWRFSLWKLISELQITEGSKLTKALV